MKEKKRKIKKYIIIGIILVLVVGGYFYIRNNAQKVAEGLQKSYVVEDVVEKGNIEISLTGSGVIQPLSRVEIPKTITGEVKTDNFEEGEAVKKDSVLYKIGNTNIKSPVKGTLITKNVQKGDYVSASTSSGMGNTTSATSIEPLAVIADISKMKVMIEIDEMDISKIKLGMSAKITCDAVPEKEYEAVVSKIAAEGKSGNGVTTFDVTLEIDNPEALKIGMNVDAVINAEAKENVLRIPMEAINKNKKEAYVYVKDEAFVEKEGKKQISLTTPSSMAEVEGYKKVVVEVGINNKDYIEILSGLEEGQKVYSVNTSKTLTEYMMSQSKMME